MMLMVQFPPRKMKTRRDEVQSTPEHLSYFQDAGCGLSIHDSTKYAVLTLRLFILLWLYSPKAALFQHFRRTLAQTILP